MSNHKLSLINLITGRSGSGKSWKVVMMILESLETRKVITNVKIDLDHPNYIYKNEGEIKEYIRDITSLFNIVDDLPKLIDDCRSEDFFEADFYIDECHLVGFRKRDEGLINWLSVRRHFNQNICLITQTLKKIHGDYIPDIHYHWTMIPQNRRVNKDMIGWYKYDEVGGDKIQTKYEKPNPEIFEIYKSGKAENERNVHVFKLLGVVGGLVASLVAVYFLFMSGFGHTKGELKDMAEHIDTNGSIKRAVSDSNVTKRKSLAVDYNNVTCKMYVNLPSSYIYSERIGSSYHVCTLVHSRS